MPDLYVSPGVVASYENIQHVDAVRWTEFYKSINKLGTGLEALNLFEYKNTQKFEPALARLEKAQSIFIHHESCLRTLCAGLTKDCVLDLLRRKQVYLQADHLHWKWLGLEPSEFLPHLTIAVASHRDSIERSLPHIPLACTPKPVIFDADSKVILYLGRFQEWFNARLRGVINAMGEDFGFKIITYEADLAKIDPDILSLPNVSARGPVSYGNLAEEIGPARFGLAFFNGWAPTGKVWDYLSMGLPVLYEKNVSESTILNSELGAEFDPLSPGDIRERALNVPQFDHQSVSKMHSWDARAEAWHKIIKGN